MSIRKAVLPVAGLGTRFLPATKAQPKEMLAIVDKPLVQYAVEEASGSGIRNLVFVLGTRKDSIQHHFERNSDMEQLLAEKGRDDLIAAVRPIGDLGQRIQYVYQWSPRGLGDAILQARTKVGNEPFAVLLPDDVIESAVPCIRQLIDVHARYKHSVIAIQSVPRETVSNYGIIRGRLMRGHGLKGRVYRIDDMVEKPTPADAPSNLAVIGRYILTPGIFAELGVTFPGAGGEVQLTDALRRMLEREPIYGYVFEGTRYDAGDKLGFLQATVELALQRPDMGRAFRKYLKSLRL
jgi:UTP--glucose-1-phosphate uridylyltransferase